MNSAKYNLPLAILMVFAIEPVVAQDLKADDFIFVPYSKPNPRNITGYYEVPEKFHRPANDGVELQLSRDENGRYNPQMVSVDAAKQMLAVGANGHFSPTKIIIGMPPYPELDEGLPAPTGAVSSATGSNGVVENPANQVGGVRGGLSESDTYIGLTQGQSFTMSNSNFVVTGNAMFPYSATEPYNYGPFGATEYVFTSSPTSLYGTFNATMGGFAIAALGSATTWNINFANVQFGACLEGSTC